MIILCVIDLPYHLPYKIVSKHRVLRTLSQNHILKVVDILNVSQFKFTDLNTSTVCIVLTSHVLLDILIQVSPDLSSFSYVNSAVLQCVEFILLTHVYEFGKFLGKQLNQVLLVLIACFYHITRYLNILSLPLPLCIQP
jgi:hypothetical protein